MLEKSTNSGKRLLVYNENGKVLFQKDVYSKEFRVEVLESGFVAVISGNKVQIYNSKGLLKFRGNFTGEIKKVKSTITVKLSPADYQSAIIAHSKNKTVMFNAVLEKEKTQYKVVELRKFKVLS